MCSGFSALLVDNNASCFVFYFLQQERLRPLAGHERFILVLGKFCPFGRDFKYIAALVLICSQTLKRLSLAGFELTYEDTHTSVLRAD